MTVAQTYPTTNATRSYPGIRPARAPAIRNSSAETPFTRGPRRGGTPRADEASHAAMRRPALGLSRTTREDRTGGMHGNINTATRYVGCPDCGRAASFDTLTDTCTVTSCARYFGLPDADTIDRAVDAWFGTVGDFPTRMRAAAAVLGRRQ